VTAFEALQEATRAGLRLRVKAPGKLGVTGPQEARARLLPVLVPLAAEILRLLPAPDHAIEMPLAFAPKAATPALGSAEDRQPEALRLWVLAHERRRAACRGWPSGGLRILAQRRPDLEEAIDRAEAAADAATLAWREQGGDQAPFLAAVEGWLAAWRVAADWLAGACHECGTGDITAALVDPDGVRRCGRCLR